jgi:diguanylate cyclase (GGDEF)-like protein
MKLTPNLYLMLVGVAGFGIGGLSASCLLAPFYLRLRRTVRHAIHVATHDILTGLLNRRHFQHHAEQLLTCHQSTLVAVFVDLNNFKEVNDQLGHEAGDEVLVHAGRILTDHLAAFGVVGRRGGDEFLALLSVPPGEDCEAWVNSLVEPLAERLRSIHNISLPHPPGASIGIYIAAPEKGRSTQTIFRRADAAMYAAKNNAAAVMHWHSSLSALDSTTDRPHTRLRDALEVTE